jgi:hypothetical protein
MSAFEADTLRPKILFGGFFGICNLFAARNQEESAEI